MYQDISVGAGTGVAAQAKILFPAQPASGDTVVFNGTTFTYGITHDFYTPGTPELTGPPIWSDRDKADLAANLANKIRATAGLGFAAYPEGPTLYLVATNTGTGPNSYTCTTSNSTAFTVPATFSGGA